MTSACWIQSRGNGTVNVMLARDVPSHELRTCAD